MDKTTLMVIGALVVVCLFLLSSCTRKKGILEKDLGFTIKPLMEDEVISSISLWNAFLANQKAANLAYKDKIIRVQGKVRFLTPQRKKDKEECYIILEKKAGNTSLIGGVQCQFLGNINDIAPGLKIGDEVTIRGTCIGKIVNVFLNNCAIGDNPLPVIPPPKEEPVDPFLTIKPLVEGDVIEATYLWDAYHRNFSKAFFHYYGKVFMIKGTIRFFGPPRFWRGNTSFIILDADMMSKSRLRGVQCEFIGNVLQDFPDLKVGDEVIIEGTGSSRFGNVFLIKCKVMTRGRGS